MQHLVPEYSQVQIACTDSLQKWSMHCAFGNDPHAPIDVDATGKTKDKRPRVWDELVRICRGVHDLPPTQLFVRIENPQLRIAMFKYGPYTHRRIERVSPPSLPLFVFAVFEYVRFVFWCRLLLVTTRVVFFSYAPSGVALYVLSDPFACMHNSADIQDAHWLSAHPLLIPFLCRVAPSVEIALEFMAEPLPEYQ